MGLRSFCAVSSEFLTGSWSLASVAGAVCGSARVISRRRAWHQGWDGARTSGELGAGGREHVDGLLDVGDAGRQVGAAREKLDLLAEVVHGSQTEQAVGGRCLQAGTGRSGGRARVEQQ
jgi:hypothetical protein